MSHSSPEVFDPLRGAFLLGAGQHLEKIRFGYILLSEVTVAQLHEALEYEGILRKLRSVGVMAIIGKSATSPRSFLRTRWN